MIESSEKFQSELDFIKEKLLELEGEIQANKGGKKEEDIDAENITERELNKEKINVTEEEFNSLCRKSFLTNEEFDKIITYAKEDNR